MKTAGHPAENCRIDISRSVGCTHDHDTAVWICHQSIPEAHELCLHHRSGFMVSASSRAKERICNKEDVLSGIGIRQKKIYFCFRFVVILTSG